MTSDPQKPSASATTPAPASPTASDNLQAIYSQRFAANQAYRQKVWQVLIGDFFQQFVPPTGSVLDLGCGYGEFINQITAGRKYGMDLNADTAKHLAAGITFFRQDCSQPWPLPENSVDVVFTSNFFEHLPDKATLGRTLEQAQRCLKPGGRLIALGPNIKYLPGQYWDFWDHYLPLTELSLSEGLRNRGFVIDRCEPRFLPYTMVGKQYPLVFIRLFLKVPMAWRLFGKQFLMVARKP